MSDFRTPAWLLGPGRPQSDLRVSDADRQAVAALSLAGHAVAWAFGGFLWIAVIGLIVLAFARRSRRTY